MSARLFCMRLIRNIRLPFQILLLAAVVLCVYYPALFAPLNSVDDTGMYTSLLNAGPLSLRELFLSGGSGTYYRPILWLSFLFDKYVWGLEESFMHLGNVLLHLINTFFVFAITRRASALLDLHAPFAPLAAAAFFAVHPLNSEAVNWISGRTDPLAAVFVLLSCWLLLRRPFAFLWGGAAALALLLACLAKETAVFFLPAALLLPFFQPNLGAISESHFTVARRSLPQWFVFLLAVSGYFLLRDQALARGDRLVSSAVTGAAETSADSLFAILATILKTTGLYAKKLVAPFPLNFAITKASDAYILLGLLVVILLVWGLRKRTFTGFFFLTTALVGSSALLVPLLHVTWTPVAERYMYIPGAFFVIGCSLAFSQSVIFIRYQKVAVFLLLAWLGSSFVGTIDRNYLWQDNQALFEDTLRKSPGSIVAREHLAIALSQKGQYVQALQLYETIDTTLLSKGYPVTMINMAGALASSGQYSKARKVLFDVLEKHNSHELRILQKLLEINRLETIETGKTSSDFYSDNVRRLARLYEIAGDPFYAYRLGMIHLHEKMHRSALQSFQEVCRTAPLNAYYLAPSEKLVATLSKELDLVKEIEKGKAKQ